MNVNNASIYAITDSTLLPDQKLFTGVEAALKGGCKLVQYRDKSNNVEKRLSDSTQLLRLCNRYNAELIINDDVHLAHEIGAHGVHLGQGDGDVKSARALLGDMAIIGVTCHNSLDLAEKAIEDGASYVAFGRFFSSLTKPDARHAPLNLLRDARIKFPHSALAAIGGINLTNANSLLEGGANLIAVCQSLFGADDIEARAQAFTYLACNHRG